jgi:hypothetical protein
MPPPQPLRDDEVVYIAIRNSSLVDTVTGRILRNAFFMRERDFDGSPPHGLSTTVLDHCPTIDEIKELTGLKSKVCGVDFLNVGTVREIGLRVERVSETKALILDMPYPADEDDYDTAERQNILADKLAVVSQRGVRQDPSAAA